MVRGIEQRAGGSSGVGASVQANATRESTVFITFTVIHARRYHGWYAVADGSAEGIRILDDGIRCSTKGTKKTGLQFFTQADREWGAHA